MINIGINNRAITLAISITLFFSQTLYASGAADPLKLIPAEEYHSQRALYYFLSNDFLSLSSLGNDPETPARTKEKVKFFLRLMDIRLSMLDRQLLIPFSQDLAPDTYYLLNANYFNGISLLYQDKISEAIDALGKVPQGDPVYPYARLAMAQAEVIRHDLKKAGDIIADLLAKLPERGRLSDLRESLYLLLGRLSYERQMYAEARDSFMKIPSGSDLHPDAALGLAWALINMKDYDDALSALKDVKDTSFFGRSHREAVLITNYCYIMLGMKAREEQYANDTLSLLDGAEKELGRIISDRLTRERYINNLLKKGDLPPTEREKAFLTGLKNDSLVMNHVKRYEFLQDMKNVLLVKEADISQRYASLTGTIATLRMDPNNVHSNLKYVARELAFNKDFVCREYRIWCQLVDFYNTSKADIKDPEEIYMILRKVDWEALLKQKNDRVGVDGLLQYVKKRNDKWIERAERGKIEMVNIRTGFARNRQEIQKAIDGVVAGLDQAVKENAMRLKYELAGLREDLAPEK